MASVVEICNGALNQLGASTILTLTEDSKNARLCNARYLNVRDAVFRHHPWNCLLKRAQLPADTETPAWGFTKQFTLPSDCLRLIKILDYESDHVVEGRKILSHSFIKFSFHLYKDFYRVFSENLNYGWENFNFHTSYVLYNEQIFLESAHQKILVFQ